MAQPIGIVAGSAEGGALCYATICLEGVDRLGPHNHAEISMHSHAFAEDVNCIGANNWAGVADLLFSSSQKPANAGADSLIAAGNTTYPAFDLVEHRWPRPWLHLAVEVATEAKRCHYKRLGVLGTSQLVQDPVYRDTLNSIEMTRGLNGAGCDAAILSRREIPLLGSPEAAPLPTLDSTGILARAALRKAVED
jgi:aspartate racemase